MALHRTLNQAQANYIVWVRNISNDNIVWSYNTEDMDIIAGMLAGAIGIIADFNKPTHKYYLDTNSDVSSYRLAKSIEEKDITFYSCRVRHNIRDNEYAIWLCTDIPGVYNLYRFTNISFLKGLLVISEAFDVNYIIYMYGLPFDNNGTLFSLQGVPDNQLLIPYLTYEDVPDSDDIDDEEVDDENVIQPLELDEYDNV